jgi:Iron-containing redox enzyme
METSSGRLRRKIELVLPEYALPGRLLLEHPHARELYPRYLSLVYFLPSTAIRLMETAIERARALNADPVAAGLVPYLERHIDEEMHGREPGAGVLSDLELTGFDTAALRQGLPPAKIAALIGSQYFWIHHAHPIGLLGYLEVVECFHPQSAVIERLVERTEYPRNAFRQLFEHAELDVEHSQELDWLLDALPLEQRHEQLLGLSALSTVELLTDALLVEVFDHYGHRDTEATAWASAVV